MVEGKVIEVFADTRWESNCRGRTCSARIEWAEVVKSGKRMCFDAPIVVLRTRLEDGTRRLIEVVALDTNHWGACPDRGDFAGKRR